MVIGRTRKHGFHDHGIQAGVDMLGGDLASVSRGSCDSLLGIDGSDEGEARQVILVGSDTWEALVVGVSNGFQDLLLSHRNGLGRGTEEDRDGTFGVGEVQRGGEWWEFGSGAKGEWRGEH